MWRRYWNAKCQSLLKVFIYSGRLDNLWMESSSPRFRYVFRSVWTWRHVSVTIWAHKGMIFFSNFLDFSMAIWKIWNFFVNSRAIFIFQCKALRIDKRSLWISFNIKHIWTRKQDIMFYICIINGLHLCNRILSKSSSSMQPGMICLRK